MTPTIWIITALAVAALSGAAMLRVALRRGKAARTKKHLAEYAAKRAPSGGSLAREALVTCPHLQRIEQDMRRAGLMLRPSAAAQHVNALCVIDREMLRAQYSPLGRIEFQETPNGPQRAALRCPECDSAIEVVHPAEAARGAPIFPGASLPQSRR